MTVYCPGFDLQFSRRATENQHMSAEDIRMNNLFERARAEEVKEKGKVRPTRILIGRLLGPLAKKSLIVNGEPMRRNSMTDKSVIVADERDFTVERQRLLEAIDRFATGGPRICTKHPHFFFGPLTPVEWASLMYQHLDHHLRQFGV